MAKQQQVAERDDAAAQLVVQNQAQELAQLGDLSTFGEEQSAQDIVMPKLLIMQPGSKLVTDGVAKFGEFRNSLTQDLMGSIGAELVLMPIRILKTWTVSKKLDGRWQFYSVENVAHSAEQRPYEEIVDDVETKNELTYNLYCLIGEDPLPYCVSLKGMSVRAGKAAHTHMYTTNQRLKKVLPFNDLLVLSGKKSVNDKGTFVTISVRPGQPASHEQKIAAANWCNILKTQNVKTDDSDVRGNQDSSAADPDAKEMEY